MFNKTNISLNNQKLFIYIVLTAITFAIYWQMYKFDFVNIDDNIYITQNIYIQSGFTLDGLRWAFSTTYADLWNPLIWISFMFDYQLYGLNAGGYHLTNLILHILSTLLLFWLFCRMTNEIWKSAFVTALFALHPLHVESVAWISERKDVLSAFFWMLTLCLYVYYTEKPAVKRYLLILFTFVLALMSKPMVVTLPVIMILLDYWPLKRFEFKDDNLILWQLKEKLPFFVLSAVFSIMTIYSHHNRQIEHFPLGFRSANALVAFVTYLEKTFWPHDLAVFYPFPVQISIWQIMGTSLLIILISAIFILMVKRLQYLIVGWLWYLITIAPVIGIIQDSDQAMADRYYYLPSIGIAVMIAWGIPSLIKNENVRKNILFPVAAAFLIIIAFLTWQQCSYWRNSIELSKHTLQATKNNFVAHNCLAYALATEGRIDEAIYHYNKAILLKPDYFLAYNNRGMVYDKSGRYQQAIEDFNMAIRFNNEYAYSYNNRGAVYDKSGQHQKALEDYNVAIRLKPDYVDSYNNRGIVFFKLGHYQKATEDFSKAINLNPSFVDAYSNRAIVYLNTGNTESGCPDAKKACDLGNCATLQAAHTNRLCP